MIVCVRRYLRELPIFAGKKGGLYQFCDPHKIGRQVHASNSIITLLVHSVNDTCTN